jgi:DNA-binding NarL/FixJ family response regulator
MINVAIVEDNLLFQSAMANLLKSSDLFNLCGVYCSAEEALLGLPRNQPDIAIIDIKLVDMSGITLIQRVRQHTPATQYMICTLHQDNEFIFEALNAGASGYILKDATGDEIKTAIKDLFLGGSPMSPYIARKIINVFREKEPLENQFGLSEREQEVLKLMSKGLLYKEIAAQLFISGNTVKNHLKNIYRKLHVQNKMEAVNKFKSK